MMVLPTNRYGRIRDLVSSVPFNHYFARSVLDRHVTGSVFVDSVDDPRTAFILHPYGLSLLLGSDDNAEFNNWLIMHMLDAGRRRARHEWMQVYPHSWNGLLHEMLGPRIVPPRQAYDPNLVEEYTRVNFEFDRGSFLEYIDRNGKELPDDMEIVEIDAETFGSIDGLVVPRSFWDDADDFLRRGNGLCLRNGGEIAAWAYTVWIHGDRNEIGIETLPKHRGKGYAEIVSMEFIKQCLKNDQVPVWSCRLENTGSYKLALKLGFKETLRVPFYRLCERGDHH